MNTWGERSINDIVRNRESCVCVCVCVCVRAEADGREVRLFHTREGEGRIHTNLTPRVRVGNLLSDSVQSP